MKYLHQIPNFEIKTAEELSADVFDIRGKADPLPSERDQNFRISTGDGRQFVLKIANGQEDPQFLEAQQQVWSHLALKGIDFCPQLIPTREGASSTSITSESGARHVVRLVTFLPGTPMGNTVRQTDALFFDLGTKLARLDAALTDFDHPAIHRDFQWDLAHGLRVVHQHRRRVADRELGRLIDAAREQYRMHTLPLLPRLRRSVIHGDVNNYNVVTGHAATADFYTRNQTVTGIIDFGDMVYSYTVGNLAVAAAYALLEKEDPLAVAAEILRGYHTVYPLTDDELAALFGLMRLRLCISVCMAAVQLAERPNEAYLAISQMPIRNALPRLMEIPHQFATAFFRHACGLMPVPAAVKVVDWLGKEQFAPVLGRNLAREKTITLDLGVGSPLLHGDAAQNDESRLGARIFGQMAAERVEVSIGRYNEPRLIYTESMFGTGSGPCEERRTLHIGLDLFAAAGTPVYAPLNGRIYKVGYTDRAQDYGGVVLLVHQSVSGDRFYTLYGHLGRHSVAALREGESVSAGDELARLGDASENGGWPPHLHLQIILDEFGLGVDFPGVARASQRAFWCQICPDPNLIVGLPSTRNSSAQDNYAQILATRKAKVGRNLSLGYRRPLKLARGWKQYLWDHQGTQYLDAYNNVPHVGHCHPHVVEAGQKQMAVLNTNTRYLHDLLSKYAERLVATMPEPLKVCFFVNSASEANELALRLARAYTGCKDMIVNEGAYHGHTTSLIDVSPYKHSGPGGAGAPEWVHAAPIADVYRGRYKTDDLQAAQKYADEVQSIIQKLVAGNKGLAGFIAETCPSVGGQIIPPDGYLDAVYRYVRAAGGIAIADEVQTGYGRTGRSFYAFETQGVVPDIVVLGKPIGNGHPIGALVTTAEIADSFDNGMEFFSTFGGNTVSCAVGLAVLEVLDMEGLQDHALNVGQEMLDGLQSLISRHEIVGDVRGAGLFLGVELVRNRTTLEPADEEASFVSNQMREQGILVGIDGPFHNVIKIRPPMPFHSGNAALLLERLDEILGWL